MTFIEKLKQIERIDALIRRRGTGSPRELAQRLQISESTLYENIKVMKDLGAEIGYSKSRRSYYYQSGGQFHLGFTETGTNQLVGGKKNWKKILGSEILGVCFSTLESETFQGPLRTLLK